MCRNNDLSAGVGAPETIANETTVFARSDAVATIYFIAQFCAASIRERLLVESGVY